MPDGPFKRPCLTTFTRLDELDLESAEHTALGETGRGFR